MYTVLSVLCNLQLSKELVRVLMTKYYSGVDRLKRVHAPPGNFLKKYIAVTTLNLEVM